MLTFQTFNQFYWSKEIYIYILFYFTFFPWLFLSALRIVVLFILFCLPFQLVFWTLFYPIFLFLIFHFSLLQFFLFKYLHKFFYFSILYFYHRYVLCISYIYVCMYVFFINKYSVIFLSRMSWIFILYRFISGHSDQFSYQPSLLNAPDLPSWIHYTYSKKDHHGFLYGVAPKDQKYFQVTHDRYNISLQSWQYLTCEIISAGDCGVEQTHLRNSLQSARHERTRERKSDEVRGAFENRQS